jgi:hydrophobic/amphiphilic exporter-1 (mainly G- bacteria), HAE1 family
VCVFGTALGMTLFGRSVNVVSLAGITFAVGMVLDNSIVALESIDTWRTRVASAAEAAYRGIQDVWGAILASTLTTAAVFVPIITWEGEVGQLLRDVAVAISFAVGFSLVVSVIVIPSMAAKVLRPRTNGNGPKPGQLASMGNRFRNTIRDQVAWVTRSAKRAGAVVALVVGTTVLLGLWLVPPLEYLPTGSRNLVFGIVVPPPGYAIEELEAMGRRTQARLAEHTGVAKDGVPAIERSFFVGSPERLFSGAIAEDPRRIGDLVTFMRGLQSEIPGVFAFTNQASLFGSTIGGGRSVEIEISGSDLVTLSELGGRMMGMLNERLPRAQVRPIPSLMRAHPSCARCLDGTRRLRSACRRPIWAGWWTPWWMAPSSGNTARKGVPRSTWSCAPRTGPATRSGTWRSWPWPRWPPPADTWCPSVPWPS